MYCLMWMIYRRIWYGEWISQICFLAIDVTNHTKYRVYILLAFNRLENLCRMENKIDPLYFSPTLLRLRLRVWDSHCVSLGLSKLPAQKEAQKLDFSWCKQWEEKRFKLVKIILGQHAEIEKVIDKGLNKIHNVAVVHRVKLILNISLSCSLFIILLCWWWLSLSSLLL